VILAPMSVHEPWRLSAPEASRGPVTVRNMKEISVPAWRRALGRWLVCLADLACGGLKRAHGPHPGVQTGGWEAFQHSQG